MSAPRPISPEALAEAVSDRARALRAPAVIAVDGAGATRPGTLAAAATERLRSAGVPVVHLESRWFWRDASVRLEYGHQDVDAYLDWLDASALRREVLDPMHEHGAYLPSLRDPATNRATRALPELLGPRGVVIVSGPMLLRHGLPFDRTVHLWASPAALARRTPEAEAWTLPAFARYDRESLPASHADVVVRCDDPRHPAALGL